MRFAELGSLFFLPIHHFPSFVYIYTFPSEFIGLERQDCERYGTQKTLTGPRYPRNHKKSQINCSRTTERFEL
jgi:hypothetical protein